MIPNSNQFPGNWKSKPIFCVGVWVGGHPPACFTGVKIAWAEHKLMKPVRDARWVRLARLVGNVILYTVILYSLYIILKFRSDSPTYISSTYVFWKNAWKFHIQIPRELDKNFYPVYPRNQPMHWISQKFLKSINLPNKTEIKISNPGIQSIYIPGVFYILINILFISWNNHFGWKTAARIGRRNNGGT